jgi:DNA-binding XRE family transcriptional regulator
MDKRFTPLPAAAQLSERLQLMDDLRAQSQAGELAGVAGVGAAVRLIRTRLRLTVAEMAKLTSVSRRAITQIESGKGNPTLGLIESLLKPLGLKISVISL